MQRGCTTSVHTHTPSLHRAEESIGPGSRHVQDLGPGAELASGGIRGGVGRTGKDTFPCNNGQKWSYISDHTPTNEPFPELSMVGCAGKPQKLPGRHQHTNAVVTRVAFACGDDPRFTTTVGVPWRANAVLPASSQSRRAGCRGRAGMARTYGAVGAGAASRT